MCFQLFAPCPDAGRGLLRFVVVVQREPAEDAVLGRRRRTVPVAFSGGLADQVRTTALRRLGEVAHRVAVGIGESALVAESEDRDEFPVEVGTFQQADLHGPVVLKQC